MKYKFILKRIQYSIVERDFDEDLTLEKALSLITDLEEEEYNFSEPECHLESITKEIGKISKIIWTEKNFFLILFLLCG